MDSKYKKMRIISQDLNLSFETQDWGIINSSSNQVGEFIDYFLQNKTYPNYIKYELYELIVASYNDLLLEKIENDDIEKKICSFINEEIENECFKLVLNYWKKNYNENEFPVYKFIEKCIKVQ